MLSKDNSIQKTVFVFFSNCTCSSVMRIAGTTHTKSRRKPWCVCCLCCWTFEPLLCNYERAHKLGWVFLLWEGQKSRCFMLNLSTSTASLDWAISHRSCPMDSDGKKQWCPHHNRDLRCVSILLHGCLGGIAFLSSSNNKRSSQQGLVRSAEVTNCPRKGVWGNHHFWIPLLGSSWNNAFQLYDPIDVSTEWCFREKALAHKKALGTYRWKWVLWQNELGLFSWRRGKMVLTLPLCFCWGVWPDMNHGTLRKEGKPGLNPFHLQTKLARLRWN